jgi:hypothetical protein
MYPWNEKYKFIKNNARPIYDGRAITLILSGRRINGIKGKNEQTVQSVTMKMGNYLTMYLYYMGLCRGVKSEPVIRRKNHSNC